MIVLVYASCQIVNKAGLNVVNHFGFNVQLQQAWPDTKRGRPGLFTHTNT